MNIFEEHIKSYCVCFFIVAVLSLTAQEKVGVNSQPRKVHYVPEGKSFVLKNGSRKFNRALYGTNTGFRAEAGDLPEFALYLPGMGGNFKFGISLGSKSKWITECDSIKSRYFPGTMLYEIRDSLLQNGVIKVQVVAHAEKEALLFKVETQNIPKQLELIWMYGGASGKKFNRDGDIGADPESVFYLQPQYCINNDYKLQKDSFILNFGSESNKEKTGNNKTMVGYFPKSVIKLVQVNPGESPNELYASKADDFPAVIGKMALNSNDQLLWKLENSKPIIANSQTQLATEFKNALQKVETLASRVKLKTPDSYINNLGGALAIAGDAIWEPPAYLHGAIAWRMPFNGWRGAYVADPLGWHDRAKMHFESYANSQVLKPEVGEVVLDSSRNFARQKEKIGTAVFSSGYISRNPNKNTVASHYDMNLVFIDQLLRNYQWTGNLEFMKKMWPVVKRHLAWEKRNFDADNDGLYDAYAAIWASDALEYSGGGVTHTSAYNYYSNLLAAQIAKLLNENPESYLEESKRIKSAVENKLWIPEKGVYAEYIDLLGNQMVHNHPGLWTIYHSLDEHLADSFQAYQSLRYVDTEIPHIPVHAVGLPYSDLYLLSTTNWQPYTWSVNNVALAENLHTALAYWQGGRPDEAFKLWQSALIESMYLGASPGGFEQLSYYDAMRGELYRDFADPIGMAARSLVEGLFGIQPNAIENTLTINPGFPKEWNEASLEIPDISIAFHKKNTISTYFIDSKFGEKFKLLFSVNVLNEDIEYIKVNGKEVSWCLDDMAIGFPKVVVKSPFAKQYTIEIKWKGKLLEQPTFEFKGNNGKFIQFNTTLAEIIKVFDPQSAISDIVKNPQQLDFKIHCREGQKTFFVQLKQKNMVWWQHIHLDTVPVDDEAPAFQDWDVQLPSDTKFEMVDLANVFNSKVTDIFEQQYLSPRPTSPTLQIPTQGIGNWCYPLVKPDIDDSGLRKKAEQDNTVTSPQGIPFNTPSDGNKNNIAFVSQWDNFPDAIEIPLSGKSTHAYFMMAGTTNPMQSRFINGEIEVTYSDGSVDKLPLKNPENWWPIEQDYFVDGLAFTTDAPKPPRIYLKTGDITRTFKDFISIKGFSDFGIDGGAGTILDLPLDGSKTLKKLRIKAIANEVIIGMMSFTLVRE